MISTYFDCENSEFKLLFNTCDSYFRELREDGIGVKMELAVTRRGRVSDPTCKFSGLIER